MDNISLSDQDVPESARIANDGRSRPPSATLGRARGVQCRRNYSAVAGEQNLARWPTAGTPTTATAPESPSAGR